MEAKIVRGRAKDVTHEIIVSDDTRIIYIKGKNRLNQGTMALKYRVPGGRWWYKSLMLDFRTGIAQRKYLPCAAQLYRHLIAAGIVPVGSFNTIAWR